jgi:capsular exopolysaccharide synthesis family protein
VRALRRLSPVVAVFAIAGLVLGMAGALLPRKYKSAGSIQVRPGAHSQFRLDNTDPANLSDLTTRLESEVSILQSDALALRVIGELKLGGNAAFTQSKMSWDVEKPKEREKLMERWAKSVSVERLPRTEIIRITAVTRSPELSASISNALMKDYVERIFRTRSESTQGVSVWLNGQLKGLKQKVEDDQAQLVAMQGKLGVVGMNQDHEINTAVIDQTAKDEEDAKMESMLAEARYRTLSSGGGAIVDSNAVSGINGVGIITQTSLLTTLRAEQADLEASLAALSSNYGRNYIEVKQTEAKLATLRQAVEQEQQRVVERARQSWETARAREAQVSALRQKQEREAYEAGGEMGRFAMLQHDFQNKRSLYERLYSRLQEAGMLSGLESSDVDIVDVPAVPSKPEGLGRLTLLLLCTGAGLIVGMAAALVVDGMDDSLREVEQVEQALGLPVLATLPRAYPPKSESEVVEAAAHYTPSFRNAVGLLCTNLLLPRMEALPKVIVVTSGWKAQGKSLLARNLAGALARGSAKVLLLDADLRQPSVERYFQVDASAGLAAYLDSKSPYEKSIQASGTAPNLFVLPAGAADAHALSIADAGRLQEMFTALRQKFEYIVVDTPPSLYLADAAILASHADAVLLVARSNRMLKSELQRTRDLLERSGAKLSGIVINDADTDFGPYAASYGVEQ